jgi:hypothetical protein
MNLSPADLLPSDPGALVRGAREKRVGAVASPHPSQARMPA